MKLYQNKKWLYQKYVIEKLSVTEMAKTYDVGETTLYRWLRKFNIKIRTPKEARPPGKFAGIRSPFWGKHHSKATKEKISLAHRGQFGILHPTWKGGKSKCKGRFLILRQDHPRARLNGYVSKSRLIMEEILRRYLKKEEVIHHVNNDIGDDRPENLKLFASQAEHISFHHKKGDIRHARNKTSNS